MRRVPSPPWSTPSPSCRTTTARRLYVSDQTPELGETVRVRVRVPRAFGTMRIVRTRSNPDREPSFSDAVVVHETPDRGLVGGGDSAREPGARLPLPDGGRRRRDLVAHLGGAVAHRDPRHRRLPAGELRPAAGLGRRVGDVPGVSRPVRALGRGRPPAGAAVGHAGRLGRPRHPCRAGNRRAVLRRRPAGRDRSPRSPGRARREPALPDPGLPGRVEPPLQRDLVRPGRPAARRRLGARRPGRGGACARASG